jgi:hypothetical protein
MVAHSGFLTTAVRCQPRLNRTPSDSIVDEPSDFGDDKGEETVDGRDE